MQDMLRMRRWMRGSATLAAGLCLLIAGCPPMNGGDNMNGNENDNTPAEPTFQLVLRDLDAGLLSIAGQSASDMYAVGADPGDGFGPYLLHYDGTEWTRIETGATGDLWWISSVLIDGDYFIVGEAGNMVRFDPEAQTFDHFDSITDATLFGVWGTDSGHVWAVGGDLNQQTEGGTILRYDGTQWTAEDLTAVQPEGVPTLFKIWGRSETEVYVCGATGLILKYDGTAWSQVDSGTTRNLISIYGNDDLVVAVGGFNDAVLTEQEGDATAFVNVAPAGTPQMNGIFVTPDGFAASVGLTTSVTFRTEEGWQVQETGFEEQINNPLVDWHADFIDPDGGIWMVGGLIRFEPLQDGIVGYYGTETIGTTLNQP